jgi:type VI secretion system protein ImpM
MILDAPGFFGKVPALGDFVSRRVPRALSASWDEWLALLTVAAREAAGSAWPEAWLTAPLWHFVLGADLGQPYGAAGVLVGSADRVGRLFPFTVIGPANGIPDDAWTDRVEDLVMQSLEDEFSPDILDTALKDLGPPTAASPIDAGRSLWWCRGSERVEPTRQLITGFPDHTTAAAMVMGVGPDLKPYSRT